MNMGDVIATSVIVVLFILVIAIIFTFIRRLKSSNTKTQEINEKLDTILQKLDKQDKQ